MENRNQPENIYPPLPVDDDGDALSPAMDGTLVVDSELRIISFSEAAERITGYFMDDVVGTSLHDIFGPHVLQPTFPIQETFTGGAIYSNLTLLITGADGAELTISLSLSPLKDVHDEIVGAVVTFRDTAEMNTLIQRLHQRNYELSAEKGKLADILNSITDGVLTIDDEWRITSFNRAAEVITGFSRSEAVGSQCGSLLRGSACDESCPMRRSIESGRPMYNVEVTITTKDGRKVPISVNTALLFDDDGLPIGAVETFRDLSTIRQLEKELESRYRFDAILGKSKPMQELYDLLENVADSDATVLIQGESGTGKELVARALHHNGLRSDKSFVAVNCSALAENLLESELFGHEKGAFTGAIRQKPGRFEMADGGTLFLDEIGDMSPALQVKLLRILDEQVFERVGGTKTIGVDVRIIAATNKDLAAEVEGGRFRQDLFYRLNVVTVWLPPLRERPEDIPLLVDHFITRFNQKLHKSIRSISPAAMRRLIDFSWPGNIRQLENAVEQAVVLNRGTEIEVRHLPRELQGEGEIDTEGTPLPGENPLGDGERQVLLRVLNETKGNRLEAAARLGISKPTLWRKMKKYGLIESRREK